MADHDDELVETVRELTRTVDDLRAELESTQRQSRRPFRPPGPRPPTPRELLRFTDEIAIPATIAVLETSVRALEGFQRALRLARTEREVRDRTNEAASATSDRATELRRTTLSRLDTVLSQLQQAASDGSLPADDRARELLSEARELRDDVDSRLQTSGDAGTDRDLEPRDDTASSSETIRIDIEDGPVDEVSGGTARKDGEPDADDAAESHVDVDAELETLKDRYGDEAATDDDENDGSNDSDGSDGADADTGSDGENES
ncbi:hypothetical protein RBH26_00470 [Natronolimnohabitans sp. A-GB9]|uniref:DUF7547 family protein n=1 Tax=Natronolimnohabitans sp. A-GB9 TaxID=3069757 RepID=UPI0027B29C57|nr:hypothetical protein [Natronolimnohabitans sp. A-GB9]MDQ2048951.1 hypothetical protein [Natronolimnohabitans sp. A-GB9]